MIAESTAKSLLAVATQISGSTTAELIVCSEPPFVLAIDTTTSDPTTPRTNPIHNRGFAERAFIDSDPDGLTDLAPGPPSAPPPCSMAVVPITGPSAEAGWLAVTHSSPDQFDATTLDDLAETVSIIEHLLDRSAEHQRIDELGDQLRDARDRLALSNQELEQFAYIAAHELVAPLRSVAVYAELLEDLGAPDNQALRSCITEIRHGVSLMNQQVQSLLALSRAEVDPSTLETVDLRAVIDEARDTLTELLEDAEATISVGTLPWVTGRSVPLQSVFANLFTNAVRYRDPDRPVEIVIESSMVGGGYEVTVSDTGAGVQPEDAQRIFQMFERGATSQPGSGIGLALSRRIMEAFGGSMGVRSAEPHGAIFWMHFPA